MATNLEQITKDMEVSQKTQQVILDALTKFTQVSELIQQASAMCVTNTAQTPVARAGSGNNQAGASQQAENSKPGESVVPPKLVFDDSVVLAGGAPVLFPSHSVGFDDMHRKFREACEHVHCKAGKWEKVTGMDSFENLQYSWGTFHAVDLFHMLWFASAALTKRLADGDTWFPTEETKCLIEAINMLNALKWKPRK